MKKVLVLGGTQFIGRCLVEELLKRKDLAVTLFNRQKTGTDLFPDVNKIKGDRKTDDIQQICDTAWDYVVDLSCYYPTDLRSVMDCLNIEKSRIIFISTTSVYADVPDEMMRNEDADTLICSIDEQTDKSSATYGKRKAECERVLNNSGFDHVILRPALVYGKYDHTDRFYYWLYEVRERETILLPDHGEREFSITYVFDLVNIIISAIDSKPTSEIYNVITEPRATIWQIVHIAKEMLNRDSGHLNASPEFLSDQDVGQWVDMPLWIDSDFFTFDNRRMIEEFNFLPSSLDESTKATVDYYNERGWQTPSYGMPAEKRLSLIAELLL